MPRSLNLMCSAFFSHSSIVKISSLLLSSISIISPAFFPAEINISFLLIFEANYLSYFHNAIYPLSNREKKNILSLMSVLLKYAAEEPFPPSVCAHHPSQCDSVPLLSLQDITYGTSFHFW